MKQSCDLSEVKNEEMNEGREAEMADRILWVYFHNWKYHNNFIN